MNEDYLHELRVAAIGAYHFFTRRILGIPPLAGRDAGIEEIRKLRIYRSDDSDPWVRAHRDFARRTVEKQFKPLLEQAREAERIDERDLFRVLTDCT